MKSCAVEHCCILEKEEDRALRFDQIVDANCSVR
jgi:hypothetical protein